MEAYPEVDTIEWHERCLKNSSEHEARERASAEKKIAECNAARNENILYAEQIASARQEGRAKFDRDRFNKKKQAAV